MKMSKLVVAVVCWLTAGVAGAVPIVYQGELQSGVTANGDVPRNSINDSAQWDYWSFFGTAGDVVSIILDRTSDQMDPGVQLYLARGGDTDGLVQNSNASNGVLTFLAFDDDSGSDNPPGPFNNALIDSFVLSTTGHYTVAAFDVLGDSSGPWSYALTARGFTGSADGEGNGVPEPASLALLGLGLLGMAGARRRR